MIDDRALFETLQPTTASRWLCSLLLAFCLLSGARALAAPAEQHRQPELIEVRLSARPIVVLHGSEHLLLDFVPGEGVTRARITLPAHHAPMRIRLLVPLPNGDRLIMRFRGGGPFRISDKALMRLVSGSVLEIEQAGMVHRLVLRDRR